jgi:two-component system sensor histidine kinase/response regulator
LAGISVLIIDPNLSNRRILTDVLAQWHMQSVAVACAPEGLALLRSAAEQGHPFSLVLIDCHMPEMAGFDLGWRIKSSSVQATPVILMLPSGLQQGELARCRALGFPDYLTKPVRRAELQVAIALALTSPLKLQPSPVEERSPQTLIDVVSQTPRPHSLRILLAEDNPVNQRLASRMLEKEGHNVVVASNGREALECWLNQPFDLILMDVQMPEMDGFEATSAIRCAEAVSNTHIPIVALTAHAMARYRERCLSIGMDDYLAKPFSKTDLLDIIAKHKKSSNTLETTPVLA